MKKLVKGQIYLFQVVELQGEGFMILAYEGSLLRVKNLMGQTLTVGEKVHLVVKSENPLQLQSSKIQPWKFERSV